VLENTEAAVYPRMCRDNAFYESAEGAAYTSMGRSPMNPAP
jgi:hypothetical protein